MSMLRRVLDRESIVKSNLTDNLVDCVKELQLKYAAERGKTLTTDEATNTLCWIIEAIFIHGLKNPFLKSVSSVLASREAQIPEPSFWEFVLVFCHQEVILQINSLSHIRSDIGRCRAWLRLVLNDGLLISYIQLMLLDKKTLKYYYKPSAFLRDSERCDIMKSYLYGIESYDFQLATNSSFLNSWNSGPLSLIGLWTPADTVFQGIDVAENMDSKDLQALPTLRSQSNTPPKPSFFPFENPYRTPLLEEDEALRVILSSRPSTSYSEPRSGTGTSTASSRRSSDHHSPLSSLTTAPLLPSATTSTGTTTKSECDGKKGHTATKGNQDENKERKRGTKHINSRKPQAAAEPIPVSFNAGTNQNEGDHLFAASTPICGPGPFLNNAELESSSEKLVSSCPMRAPDIVTPEEETSYAALFQSYNKSDSVIGTPITVGSFLDSSQFRLPIRTQNETTASSDPALGSSIEDNHSASVTPVDTLGFEVISHDDESSKGVLHNESIQKDKSIIRRIANEVGLDEQNYKCRYCGRLIGMIYGAARVCWFTGYYYCTECHINDELVIPARILLNWDFAKYSVCKKSKEDLQSAWDQPILDINEINAKLYKEVQECADLQVLRIKLQSISIYLRTCKEPIMNEFIKDVWPREYLYEEIHSYSLSDLLNIPNRTLATTLTKLLNIGRNHIKYCGVCKQKGFVCEMCKDPKVIFPFDLEQIFKCLSCGAVYHNKCMNHSIACPRCVRWKIDSYATELTSL